MLKYSKNYQVNTIINKFYLRVRNTNPKFTFKLKMINAIMFTLVLISYSYLGINNWIKWFQSLGNNSALGIILFALLGSKFYSIFNLLLNRFPHLKKILILMSIAPILIIPLPYPIFGSFSFLYIYILWAFILLVQILIFFLVYVQYKNLYVAFIEKMRPWVILKIIFSIILLSTTFSQSVFIVVWKTIFLGMLYTNLPIAIAIIFIIVIFIIVLQFSIGYYIAFFFNWKYLYPIGVVQFRPLIYMSFIRIGVIYFLISIQLFISGKMNNIHIGAITLGVVLVILHIYTINYFKKTGGSSIMITLINMGFVLVISTLCITTVFISNSYGGALISGLNILPLAPPFIIWGISNASEVKKKTIISDFIIWFFTSITYSFLIFILIILVTTDKSAGIVGQLLNSSSNSYSIRLMITVTGIGILVVSGHAIDISIKVFNHSRYLKKIGK